MKRVDVAVVELGGVELAGLPLDQHRGHVEQVGVGLLVADLAEIGLRLVHFVGVAKRLQQQPASAGLQCDDIFLASHRELADADLLGRLQRIAQDDIGFLGEVVRWNDEIGLVVEHRVDVADVDELDEVQSLAALQLDAVDLLLVEEDIMPFGDLVALDDLVAVDGADARHDLLIFNALPRRLVDLMELDLGAAPGGGEQLHGDRHQRKADLSSPDRARGHLSSP